MEGRKYFTTLCYIEQNGKWLMLHRVKKEHDRNKDKYIGVGGSIEHGESPEECIRREIYEETGLTAGALELRGFLTFVMDDDDEYTFLYTCKDFSGSLKECNEGNLEWIDKFVVPSLPLWEGDKLFFSLLDGNRPFFSLKLVYQGDRLISHSLDL